MESFPIIWLTALIIPVFICLGLGLLLQRKLNLNTETLTESSRQLFHFIRNNFVADENEIVFREFGKLPGTRYKHQYYLSKSHMLVISQLLEVF